MQPIKSFLNHFLLVKSSVYLLEDVGEAGGAHVVRTARLPVVPGVRGKWRRQGGGRRRVHVVGAGHRVEAGQHLQPPDELSGRQY